MSEELCDEYNEWNDELSCDNCGPWCEYWAGDGLCELEAQRFANQIEEYEKNHHRTAKCPVCGAELEEFDEPIEITIHYPDYYAKGIDEDLLAIYEFNPRTRTWVLMGGNVNPYGNMIKLLVNRTGTYGIFYDPNFRYSPGEVFSGVTFSPNPFSPNGDGIYDETYISFYLTKEATVTVEIYNIDGYRVKILEKRFAFTAEDTPDNRPRRITGLVWDGRDNMGKIVPYGIYIARFTVTFQQAGGQRTIRTNAAVAVIK